MKRIRLIASKGFIALFLVSALIAFGACTYSSGYVANAAAPTISIVSPTNGATLSAGDIPVTVSVSNFAVVDKQGQANVSSEGHVHFYLDVSAPTTPGQPAVPAGGTWAHVSGLSYTFTNVAPGTHTITVQLVNNDHTPVVPLATASITINVTAVPAAAPTISITAPISGATLPAGAITVNTEVTNFNVVDKQGQADVPGQGHVHFYLDVAAPTTPDQPAAPASGVWAHVSGTTYTFTGVTPGTHTITVQLVNNDHTPIIPLVTDSITINVTATGSSQPTPTYPSYPGYGGGGY